MRDYSTLPKIAGFYIECLECPTQYIGTEIKHKWIPGDTYLVKWKYDPCLWEGGHFSVIQSITTRINKNGKPEGYRLVVPYASPEAILADWDFKDLREWSEKYK